MYREHSAYLCGKKRERRDTGGAQHQGVQSRSDFGGSPSQFSVIIPQTKSNDFSTSASQAGLLAKGQKYARPQYSWPSRKSKSIAFIESAFPFWGFPSQRSQDGWRFIWGQGHIIISGLGLPGCTFSSLILAGAQVAICNNLDDLWNTAATQMTSI